jgi:hypothetical protein
MGAQISPTTSVVHVLSGQPLSSSFSKRIIAKVGTPHDGLH